MGALATLGGADMVSVYVRLTLIQIVTPDPMRGRVASVRIFGPVLAAILGGVASLFVTGIWARIFPTLRKGDRLE